MSRPKDSWSVGTKGEPRCKRCGLTRGSKPQDSCPEGHKLAYGKSLATARRISRRNYANPLKRELILEKVHKQTEKLRIETMLAYGGKCTCCGYADITKKIFGKSMLEVHHVKGNGNTDRQIRGSGYKFYLWLKKYGYPQEGLGILCKPCNSCMEPEETTCELHKIERGLLLARV